MFFGSIVLLILIHVVLAQPPGKGAAPPLISLDAKGIDALRAKHKGDVLVINFWATWCKPCVQEFPELVKLQQTYANNNVEVMFISIDDDDAKTKRKVVSFLKKMNITTSSYLKRRGNDEAFINAVHPNWSGALPTTLVYKRNGELAAMKSEELNFDELQRLIVPLLK